MTASLKIVFFGSGPVASATLDVLRQHFTIEAVITKPRAPGHRGNVPVLELATAHNLPLHTPTNKAELTEVFATHTFASQVGVVVDYGIIISKQVIEAFPKGIVNSHFSLLPQWRGADPITFSVLSGQQKTGVSLMLINEKLDEGQLLAQTELPLPADITTPHLTEQLIALSNDMLIRDLPRYIAGDIKPYVQPTVPEVSYSRRLVKEDSIIDTKKPALQIEREIRAFAGWPKSRLELFGHTIIVKKARVARNADDGALVIPCGNHSFLEILELTAPSGRTMSGADFLRGYRR